MDFQTPVIRQHLRLGLCCLNTILREQKIFCSRTCTRANFTVERAQEKAFMNLRDLITMIEWNHHHDISCFRISSDIFPHFTDTETPSYTIDFARDLLRQAGDLVKQYGHRIIMHPAQFNQVGAVNPLVFQKTESDLKHHAEILDAMGLDHNAVIIVHGGGVYGSKTQTIQRWVEQFQLLPENVRHRLVIENCERNYNADDCLQIANRCGISVVFDFHHYQCWKGTQRPIRELIPDIIKTWQLRQQQVVMHISDQDPTRRLGAHHDYVEVLPPELFDAIITYGVDIDLEIEAKMKEQAIFRLYTKYRRNVLRLRLKSHPHPTPQPF